MEKGLFAPIVVGGAQCHNSNNFASTTVTREPRLDRSGKGGLFCKSRPPCLGIGVAAVVALGASNVARYI